MQERVYIFVGCNECPYSFRSYYKTYLYCRWNSKLNKGSDEEHDISNVEEYPKYCWFTRKTGDR
jgi:hypothetical protein